MENEAFKSWHSASDRVGRAVAQHDRFGRQVAEAVERLQMSMLQTMKAAGMSGFEAKRIDVRPDPDAEGRALRGVPYRLNEQGRVPLRVTITFGLEQHPIHARVPVLLCVEKMTGEVKVIVGKTEFPVPADAVTYTSMVFDLAAEAVEQANHFDLL